MRKFGKSNPSHTCRVATPVDDENAGPHLAWAGEDARTTAGQETGGTTGLETGGTGFRAIFRADPSAAFRDDNNSLGVLAARLKSCPETELIKAGGSPSMRK